MPQSGPRPGQWDTDFVPYLRAPLQAFADPRYEVVVLMTPAQSSKTEALLCVAGWHMDCFPRETLIYEPTEKLARSLCRTRLDQMFNTAPGLAEKMDRRFMKPGSLERYCSGARLGVGWMGSKVETASHPAALVLVDEIDLACELAVDSDPIGRAEARTKAFSGSKLGLFSTTTDEETSPIYKWWKSGTKMRWAWTCPKCGHEFAPELEHARYPEKAEYVTIRAEAFIECPQCLHEIHDEHVEGLQARYVPYLFDEDHQLFPAPDVEPVNSVASYWLTGFASPISGIGEIMERYARAAREGQIEDVRNVVTEWVGQPWREKGERVREDDVRDCQRAEAPDGDAALVTAFVDVQDASLYVAVRGWWPGVTSMLAMWTQLRGATEYDDVWMLLQQSLDQTFFGRKIDLLLVDSGFRTAQVYEWCRRVPYWSPSKGVVRMEKPFRDMLVDEAPSGRARRTLKRWDFHAHYWKSWLYERICWPKDKPGAWYVPAGIEDEYCSQVTNEQKRIVRGRVVWERTGDRHNHLHDCEVGCAVAAHILNVRAIRFPTRESVDDEKVEQNQRRRTLDPFARRPL